MATRIKELIFRIFKENNLTQDRRDVSSGGCDVQQRSTFHSFVHSSKAKIVCSLIVLAVIMTVVIVLITTNRSASGDLSCSFTVNDLGQPQPLYLYNDDYLKPTGNTGIIKLNTGDQVVIACPGRMILHQNLNAVVDLATATCVNNDLVSGAGWLHSDGAFTELTCSGFLNSDAVLTTDRCYNNNYVIRVGFTVAGVFYPLYWSCFDQKRLEVLYVWYEQNPQNALPQTGVKRPDFSAGNFYDGVDVNKMYTQNQQKATIANILGSDMASKYITNTQFISRGHLAAATDFIYANGQRASYYFINVAPQWQSFNSGNWNLLERNLRTRIGEAGYNTIIYTGTFGTTQLRDENDKLVDIYLYTDANNNPQIPVPLYYYKVVYDASRRLGTAFVGINNPYYSETELKVLAFCTDRCRNNSAFNWLRWQPDRIEIGYSFCCTIDDFRKTVPHLPDFPVDDLLT